MSYWIGYPIFKLVYFASINISTPIKTLIYQVYNYYAKGLAVELVSFHAQSV